MVFKYRHDVILTFEQIKKPQRPSRTWIKNTTVWKREKVEGELTCSLPFIQDSTPKAPVIFSDDSQRCALFFFWPVNDSLKHPPRDYNEQYPDTRFHCNHLKSDAHESKGGRGPGSAGQWIDRVVSRWLSHLPSEPVSHEFADDNRSECLLLLI